MYCTKTGKFLKINQTNKLVIDNKKGDKTATFYLLNFICENASQYFLTICISFLFWGVLAM